MGRGKDGRWKRARLAAALAGAFATSEAWGGLTYDLRFADGSQQKTLSTGSTGSYELELWAQVSGSDGNLGNEGFSSGYIVLESVESAGNLFDGSLFDGTAESPFNQGRNGAAGNLTSDGVGDWGSTSTLLSDSRYMYARNPSQVFGGGTVGQAVDANTWEFKIATFGLQIDSVHPIGGDETRIAVLRPAPTFPVVTLATYAQDGVTRTVTNTNYQGTYGSYVTLTAGSNIIWSGGAGGTGNAWTNAADWSGSAVPGASDVATFSSAGTATVIGIDAGAVSGGNAAVGEIVLDASAGRDIALQNSSLATDGTLQLNGVGGIVFDNQSAGHSLVISNGGSHPLSLNLPANATINVADASSTIEIDAPINSASLVTKTGAGKLVLTPQSAWSVGLAVSGGKVEAPAEDATFYLTSLGVAPGAALDLNADDLVVENGSFSELQALVLSGYRAGPDASATGIVSTNSQNNEGNAILLLFDNALVGAREWPVGSGRAIGGSAIVGKYTYFGDTNLDGQITAADYNAVDAGLGTTNVDPGMANLIGDTNFDLEITAADYNAIDARLGLGVGSPLGSRSVPDSAGSGALLMLVAAFFGDRRRVIQDRAVAARYDR